MRFTKYINAFRTRLNAFYKLEIEFHSAIFPRFISIIIPSFMLSVDKAHNCVYMLKFIIVSVLVLYLNIVYADNNDGKIKMCNHVYFPATD